MVRCRPQDVYLVGFVLLHGLEPTNGRQVESRNDRHEAVIVVHLSQLLCWVKSGACVSDFESISNGQAWRTAATTANLENILRRVLEVGCSRIMPATQSDTELARSA